MIGRNFFTEIAPCAAVKEFQGRFNDFLLTPGNRIESFGFFMKFGWGERTVTITMVKRAEPAESIYLVVNVLAIPV